MVVVVIDTGFSTGEPIVGGDDKSQNPLATAQDLSRVLMDILSKSDFINIIVYNATVATLLAPNPVAVNDSNADTYPPVHPEFDHLTSSLLTVAVGMERMLDHLISPWRWIQQFRKCLHFQPEFVKE